MYKCPLFCVGGGQILFVFLVTTSDNMICVMVTGAKIKAISELPATVSRVYCFKLALVYVPDVIFSLPMHPRLLLSPEHNL